MNDLGTFECISDNGNKCEFIGLDGGDDDYARTHLPHNVRGGSTAFCLDSGATWIFHSKSDEWYKL